MKFIWVFILKFRLIYCFCIHVRSPFIWAKYRQYHVNLFYSHQLEPVTSRSSPSTCFSPPSLSHASPSMPAALSSPCSRLSTRASPACARPTRPPLWAHARVRESLAIGYWSLQELILSSSVDARCHAAYATWLLVCVVYANADLKLLVIQQRAPFIKVAEPLIFPLLSFLLFVLFYFFTLYV